MEQVQLLNEVTDIMYENAVMLYDKDKDGALGFHNNEFALLVLQLLVRNEGPGVSKEHLNAGDRARKERAVHIARLIASHPGFSGQSGATPSALRAATEAGIFQELTPVMQSWIEGAVNKYLIRLYEQEIEAAKQQEIEAAKQQEIEGRRVVTPAIPAGISQHREFHSMPVEREATARWNYHWFPQYRGNQSMDCTWNHHSAYHSASASMDCT
jgi:hypothetical protein